MDTVEEQSETHPGALLLITSDCPHCPGVLHALSALLKQGRIGHLEVFNIGIHPEQAAKYGARAVPWTRIGPFVLPGNYPPDELQRWAERAGSRQGMADYFAELLENQRIDEALALVRQDPGQLALLVDLVGDLETPMGVRIGIGAMFEDLAEQGGLAAAVDALGELTHADQPQVRADAAYYLGLAGPSTRPWLTPLLHDSDHEVREIASETLAGFDV